MKRFVAHALASLGALLLLTALGAAQTLASRRLRMERRVRPAHPLPTSHRP